MLTNLPPLMWTVYEGDTLHYTEYSLSNAIKRSEDLLLLCPNKTIEVDVYRLDSTGAYVRYRDNPVRTFSKRDICGIQALQT